MKLVYYHAMGIRGNYHDRTPSANNNHEGCWANMYLQDPVDVVLAVVKSPLHKLSLIARLTFQLSLGVSGFICCFQWPLDANRTCSDQHAYDQADQLLCYMTNNNCPRGVEFQNCHYMLSFSIQSVMSTGINRSKKCAVFRGSAGSMYVIHSDSGT